MAGFRGGLLFVSDIILLWSVFELYGCFEERIKMPGEAVEILGDDRPGVG